VAGGGHTGGSEYDAWLATNVEHQKQPGYAAVTVRVDQGKRSPAHTGGLARIPPPPATETVRLAIQQNLLLAFIPRTGLPRCIACCASLVWRRRARGESKICHLPGASTWQPGLTKTMNLGVALERRCATTTTPGRAPFHQNQRVPQRLRPSLDADFGFYGQRA